MKDESARDLTDLINDFVRLKEIYDGLWNIDCSSDNFPPLLQQYDIMIEILESKLRDINSNNPWQDPNIPSKWIYSFKKKKLGVVLSAYFQKTFIIDENEPLDHVKIQLIGDTHNRVWLNGEMIHEGFSKKTLSLIMLNNLKQLIDMTGHVRPGENELIIENHNYQGGFGIVNVFGEIKYKNGQKKQIISDESWLVSESMPNASPKSLISVSTFGNPPAINGTLTFPDFEKNIPSFSTSIIGVGSIGLRYIPWSLRKLHKFLSKLAIKLNLLV